MRRTEQGAPPSLRFGEYFSIVTDMTYSDSDQEEALGSLRTRQEGWREAIRPEDCEQEPELREISRERESALGVGMLRI